MKISNTKAYISAAARWAMVKRVELLSSNPNLGKIYDYGQGQLYLVGENENDFMITFIIDKATVELAKIDYFNKSRFKSR